jgi:hypothetical protein
MGEGWVKGGILGRPGPYYTSPCFPITHVTGAQLVSIPGWYVEGPRIESRPSRKENCGHMLHYTKLCLWGATIRLMLSLISMSTVALWSATRAAMPKVRGLKLGRTNSLFDKLNLKSFRSWWKWKIGVTCRSTEDRITTKSKNKF